MPRKRIEASEAAGISLYLATPADERNALKARLRIELWSATARAMIEEIDRGLEKLGISLGS